MDPVAITYAVIIVAGLACMAWTYYEEYNPQGSQERRVRNLVLWGMALVVFWACSALAYFKHASK